MGAPLEIKSFRKVWSWHHSGGSAKREARKTRTDIKSRTWNTICLSMKPTKMSSVKGHEVSRDAWKHPDAWHRDFQCRFGRTQGTAEAMLWTCFHFTLFSFPFQLQLWKCFMLWDFWSFSKRAEVFQFCFYSWSLSLTPPPNLYILFIFYCQVYFKREIPA